MARRELLEKQRENVENLLKLIEEHPDYPIVPIVDSEVVADDGYCWWMGSFGRAYTVGIFVGKERYYEYVPDDWEEWLHVLNDSDYSAEEIEAASYDDGEAMKKLYDSLPWVDVIAVRIDTPESLKE